MKSTTFELNPGSPEAIAKGCTCTSPHNEGGKGWYGDGEQYGWDMAMDCPLHGIKPRDDDA